MHSISGILKCTSRWSPQGRQLDLDSQPFPEDSLQKDEYGGDLILSSDVLQREHEQNETTSSPTT